MTDKPDATLKFPRGHVSLYRNVKWVDGTQEVVGDRMLVQHVTGSQDNVAIFKQAGKLVVKRLVDHVEFFTSSPGQPSGPAKSSQSFADDLDDEDTAELLELYKDVSAD